MTIAPTDFTAVPAIAVPKRGWLRDLVRRHPTALAGAVILALMVLMAIFAPFLGTVDPQALSPIRRLRPPQSAYWFGTDMLGRDVYSRVVYGARVSLTVGISVALFSSAVGVAIGMVTGFVRLADAIVMRVMDGLMSIPSVLLAIALMALTKASIGNVIFAITVVEVPRVTRRVRSVLWRHILPNTIAPVLVQGTFIAASAMITEAVLSFIGAGTPPNIPSWGNIMAEGRSLFQVAYYIILFPGICLSLAVLSINLLGDGLRDALDPRLARRM
jgi:peptide/nickel transport system permease protein